MHGINISLADFGKWYSSLSTLKELNVDAIKLDCSFFFNENENTRKIVSTFIFFADQLGMKFVAEGIESTQQLQLLETYRCDMVKLYGYSKPV